MGRGGATSEQAAPDGPSPFEARTTWSCERLRVTDNVNEIISLPIDDPLEPLRRDRQRRDRARHADGGLDRGRDRRADGRDAAFARALDAERVERGRRILGEDDLDRRG